MSAGFVAPLMLAATVALLAGLLQARLRPRLAAATLAVACAAVAAATVWTLLALLLGALAESPVVSRWLSWCLGLDLSDDHVSGWIGLGAGVLLTLMLARAARTMHARQRLRRRLPAWDGSVLVLDSSRPTAYAVPGRHGGVVVSQGMIDALEPAERTVMWAHEQSHRAHRHDRYLVASDIAVAIVPLLRPLAEQVHFATERWADEDAAATVGGDRGLVARSIARAAVATVDHRRSSMALAEMGVADRVQALVGPDRPILTPPASASFAAVVIGSAISGTGFQLHHLVTLLVHLCGSG